MWVQLPPITPTLDLKATIMYYVIMDVEMKLIATAIFGLIGTGLTFARRYNNKDREAGIGCAGWTIVIIIFLWIG